MAWPGWSSPVGQCSLCPSPSSFDYLFSLYSLPRSSVPVALVSIPTAGGGALLGADGEQNHSVTSAEGS